MRFPPSAAKVDSKDKLLGLPFGGFFVVIYSILRGHGMAWQSASGSFVTWVMSKL